MFTSETLRFLRALKRNNDREWFKARRDRYDAQVREPMITVIERLPQLVRIREHIATTHPELEQLARARTFRRVLGPLEGERLTRVPRGYAKDDPAAEYLKLKQFLAGREFPPTFATSTEFYPALVENL